MDTSYPKIKYLTSEPERQCKILAECESPRRINRILIQRPENYNLRELIKNKEVCQGLTQMHGLQWRSSDLLFRSFRKICKKAFRRDQISFQVNFLATNRSLNYTVPAIKQMSSVSSDTKIKVILAENYKVVDIALQRIAKALRYLKQTRNVALDVAQCDRITDHGVINFMKTLPMLRRLNKLNSNEFTDKGLFYFSQKVSRISKHLTCITLYFIRCQKVTDAGIKSLGHSLSQIKTIRILNLHLCWLNSISNNGFIELGKALSTLSSLTYLTLHFMKCPNLVYEGFSKITESFSRLSKLESINLTFFKYELTDDELQCLANSFKGHPSLMSITLRFAICPQITDVGVSAITNSISSLTQLNSLILNFIDCTMVSDQAIFNLSDTITALVCLKTVELSFFQCPLITEKGQQEIIRVKEKIAKAYDNITLD